MFATKNGGLAVRDNPTLEWTGPAERSSWLESWSAPGRPFNVGPLSGGGEAVDDIRRVMEMVAALHRLGYERLRLVPAIYPTGDLRMNVSAVSNVRRKHGARVRDYSEGVMALCSTGQGAAVFGWEDAQTDAPEELARKFIERFPGIAAAGNGSDPAYVEWYRQMLELTAPEGTFYADADYFLLHDCVIPDEPLPTLGVPRGVVIPLPPPGEAD